jgi:hypothetical protein
MNEDNIEKLILTFYKFSEKINPVFTEIVSFPPFSENLPEIFILTLNVDEQKKFQKYEGTLHGQGHSYHLGQPRH